MDETRRTTRKETAFRPLFFTALAVCAVLGLACGLLALRRGAAAARAGELGRQAALLEQQVANLQAVAAKQRGELETARSELEKARDTVELMREYSIAAPDGTVPEYTKLYPDFYAQEWTGERVEGGKVCCLTFDDGPSANTDRVLEILDRYGVKATFFVVGSAATSGASQQRMKNIAAAGHTLGMHSWSHDYRTLYASVEAFLDEYYRLYQWIHEVTGVYPQVFRFPGGSINGYSRGLYQEIIAEMTRRGFVYYDWNASAQDATVRPRPAHDIATDCLRGVGRDLAVVLCHDSGARATTVAALPAVIEGYQDAGYTFAALNPGVKPVTMGYPRPR